MDGLVLKLIDGMDGRIPVYRGIGRKKSGREPIKDNTVLLFSFLKSRPKLIALGKYQYLY